MIMAFTCQAKPSLGWCHNLQRYSAQNEGTKGEWIARAIFIFTFFKVKPAHSTGTILDSEFQKLQQPSPRMPYSGTGAATANTISCIFQMFYELLLERYLISFVWCLPKCKNFPSCNHTKPVNVQENTSYRGYSWWTITCVKLVKSDMRVFICIVVWQNFLPTKLVH